MVTTNTINNFMRTSVTIYTPYVIPWYPCRNMAALLGPSIPWTEVLVMSALDNIT